MTNSTKDQRQQQVDQTNALMRQSGFEPDADLLDLQRQYVEGSVSIQDLLDWGMALNRRFQQEDGQEVGVPKDAH